MSLFIPLPSLLLL